MNQSVLYLVTNNMIFKFFPMHPEHGCKPGHDYYQQNDKSLPNTQIRQPVPPFCS